MEKHIDIEKDVVSFQQAIDLCMIGFNEKTLCAYEIENQELYLCHLDEEGLYMPEKDMPAPLRSQVFRWFREKYNLHYRITYYDPIKAIEFQADYQGFLYKTSAASFDGSLYLPHQSYWKLKDSPYSTYEEAENACIDELIELAKQQDNE